MATLDPLWTCMWVAGYLAAIGLNLCALADGSRLLYEKCPDGYFGFKCSFVCRCALDLPCDKESGLCQRGCKDGFWGPGCQLTNSCYYNGQKRSYMGTLSYSKTIYTCQQWTAKIPQGHSYRPSDFPDGVYPRNYCRTTPDSEKPWCYTTGVPRWEYCNINACDCPTGRFGHNCRNDCHCHHSSSHCDSVTGRCLSGCATGWTGADCQTAEQCPINRYGWDCERICHCENHVDCERFLGPTEKCVCKKGFFNPPYCEPVTAPRIVFFGNEKVNPGQTAQFNCTVAAFPTPHENDITLQGPVQKQISLISSNTLEKYLYTRINIFQVKYVMNGARFTCAVQTVAGSSHMTIVANVYELPRLNTPPTVVYSDKDASELTLNWHRWDPAQGDTGNGPIVWYYVYIRHERENNFTMTGQLYHALCKKTCTFTLSELEPNSKYSICISTRREGDKGEGPHGPVIHVRTKCTEPLLGVTIEEITSKLQYNASYPKTKILVKWKDPPASSINCNRIQKYTLYVGSESSRLDSRVPDVDPLDIPTGTTQTSVSNLEPFTQYCVVIVFENNGGLRSPESRRECIVTSQTTPDPPENVAILSRSSSTVTMSWNTPLLSFGVVTKFHILYWEGDDDSPKGVEMKPEGQQEQFEFLLSGLQANTYYRLQVRAVNSAGAGEPSQMLSFTTEEGLPGPVSHLTNISRTSTSIALQWRPPQQQNGQLLYFLVHCEVKQTLSNGVPTLQPQKPTIVPASVLELIVGNLVPASLYRCSVKATTKAGTGEAAVVNIWTHPEVLSPPVSPEITKVTDNTVTLRLHEARDRTVSYYRIIVEKVNSNLEGNRSRRHIPKYISEISQDYQTALRDGQNTYVTAQLAPNQLRGTFVVGDNRTYDGYFNGPLQQDQKYTIWLGAYSHFDGTNHLAFVKADRPVVARSMTATDSTSSVPVIVGVIVVFILLVAILAVLLLIWRRRHIAEEREKAEIPSFGPTIVPEPETSTPPTPIGRTMFHFAENIEVEPLIENASAEILLDTEPVYSNTSEAIAPIRVEDLWDYIRMVKLNDLEGLKKEFKLLPAGITSTCEIARKNENKLKNRYGNIIAYDHTRVVLDVEGYDPSDDYINANYIDGYNKQRAYIAAQGPSKPTVNDIWRMVWKENSKTIIMLTNPTESGKRKCEQYWPEDGCGQYGNISAQLLDVDVLPDFTVRTFLISKGGQSKYVKQFHYTTWPDHGVPRFGHSLLLFRQKIRAYDCLDNGALVIHCSAGVGRTGTYISVDTQLEKAKSEGIIDVYNFVQLMRTQRVNMVQTLEQYIFVYDCLLEALICGDTTVSSHAFPEVYTDLCLFDNDISKTKLEEQFEILKLLSTTIERDESTTAMRPENIFKNRCRTIIPANRCRPYLMTACEGSNDYINAVFLNSYRRKDRLLVTQMPLPNTVTDFWRLVYDHKCFCIVMLNEVEKEDETCEQYWTEEPGGSMYGPFQVETTSVIKSNPIVTVRDFTLTNTETEPEVSVRHIRQLHFHRWQEGCATPSSQRALLELVHMTNTWQQSHDGPITVHCMNGASRSGLFCAALTILERVHEEKEVDVFQAVKQLRLNRTQLIDNMEQYQFCHEVVMEYLSNPDGTALLS